jgi:glycosyltransferase involved in cell wall biosynthesis
MIDDNVTGLLVEPDDERALQKAMLRLLCESGLARALGAAARRRVAETFDAAHVCAITEKFYCSLLHGGDHA